MREIDNLSNFDIPYVLIGVIIIIAAIVGIWDLLSKFSQHISKPFNWITRNDHDHEELEKLRKQLEEFKEHRTECMANVRSKNQEIENKIDKLTEMFIDKQIDDYRWEIINTADKIANGRNLSRDAYHHCFGTYENYERILKEFGRTNHEVDLSIDIIRKSYQANLINGFNYRVSTPQELNDEEEKTETPS